MKARHVLSLIPAFALAACGDSSTAPRGALQADEVVALAQQFDAMAVGGISGSGIMASRAPRASGEQGFSAALMPVSLTVEATVPCQNGGESRISFAVSGQVDPEAGSMNIDVTGTQSPQRCAFPLKDLVFTVTGTPGLTSTAHLAMTNGAPTGLQTSSTTGSFDWSSSDGRSGHCTVNYATEVNFAAGTSKVDGTFCGTTIHYSGPLSPQP